MASAAAGRRHLRCADIMKLLVRRTIQNYHWRQRLRNFGRSHLEQSTSSFKTVFLLGSHICAETENFLVRQRDDVAHLRTSYFALYKCTHYCNCQYKIQLRIDCVPRERKPSPK